MKILFFGTPQFAVPTLHALHDAGHDVHVVTRPDRPVGRKQMVTPPPVKNLAMKFGIPFEQPAKLDDNFVERQKVWAPNVAVLAAYGKIIKPDLLVIPTHGFVNVHPSLLPRHRGASPIAGTILAGDSETGVTIMKMDEGLDTGPILSQEKILLTGAETCDGLTENLADLGARLLVKTISAYVKGALTQKPQDEQRATTTSRLTKESGRIDWTRPAGEIERMVRAYTPWPSAWTVIGTKRLKIFRTHVGTGLPDEPETMKKQAGLFGVVCGDQTLLLLDDVQFEGSKRLSGLSFANGFSYLTGQQIKKTII